MAERACASLGLEQQTFWFDSSSRAWRAEGEQASQKSAATQPGLKRRLFPSTLYESGRPAVKAFHDTDWSQLVPAAANVILHTTYLAPLLSDARPPWLRAAVVDVYDLVWRAHAIDARQGDYAARAARKLYSQSVRRRETKALSSADLVAVAGYDDWRHVRDVIEQSSWCPTGMAPLHRPVTPAHDPPVVGFLGNFAHQPTIDSARYLVDCRAARSGEVKVVLAGHGSSEYAHELSDRAEILGEVDSPADLWHRVDCAVIPVQSGAGMKCKISEALLAGCPVITTPLGAEGFPPAVRRLMHVVETVDEISAKLCNDIERPDLESPALGDLAIDGATKRYADMLRRAT